MSEPLLWYCKYFSELSTNELYDILKLRIDVFVVEQTCYYPDIDLHDKNPNTLHLFAYYHDESTRENKVIAAYLRILPKDTSYTDYISIGRVVVAPEHRGKKLGHLLMEKALTTCESYFPIQSIKISAQAHLEKYYQTYGFTRISDIYLEDNIPHIAMLSTSL